MVLGYRVLVLLTKLVTLGKTHSSPEQAGMHVVMQVPSSKSKAVAPASAKTSVMPTSPLCQRGGATAEPLHDRRLELARSRLSPFEAHGPTRAFYLTGIFTISVRQGNGRTP